MSQSFASANDTQEQKARVLELAKGVYGYVSDYDPNCGFIVGDEGVLVIDCRATPALAREMIADIKTVTDKPIQYIALTHYHAVRVFGAAAFGVDAIFASTGTAKLIEERARPTGNPKSAASHACSRGRRKFPARPGRGSPSTGK